MSGRGELFKSGGRVMKNVTGYDLSKGLAGSWGTLAVLTKVTFKVLPAAETEQTLVLRGLDDAQAAAAMATAMGSNAEISSAAHLPETVTGKVISGALSGQSSTLLRLEGFPASVAYRAGKLAALLKGKTDILPEPDSRALWREIRDCQPFADGTDRPVWRVSAAPMSGHAILADFRLDSRRRRLLRLAGRPDLDPLRGRSGSGDPARADQETRRRPRHAHPRQRGPAPDHLGLRAAAARAGGFV